jgi:gas vesicle protein
MLSPRLLLGAVIGGAAVYFLDPVSGAERRARFQARWEQNREPILNTASRAAATAQESASQVGDQAAARVSELKAKVGRSSSGSAGSD